MHQAQKLERVIVLEGKGKIDRHKKYPHQTVLNWSVITRDKSEETSIMQPRKLGKPRRKR